MALRVLMTVLSLLDLSRRASAQFGPDQRWTKPDGSKSDFTSTFNVGDTITLAWKASLNNSRSDLWLTHWDPATYPWHVSVATNIDISAAGNLQWKIDVPQSTVQNDNRFVLRFFPKNAPYGLLQFQQNDSPGFLLTGGTTNTDGGSSSKDPTQTVQSPTISTTASITSPTPSTLATTTTTNSQASDTRQTTLSTFATVITSTNAGGSTVYATITTSAPVPTDVAGSSQSTSTSSSKSLSLVAQIGIGVGAGVIIIILFIAGCFFGRRYHIAGTLRHSTTGLEKEVYPMLEKKETPFSETSVSSVRGENGKIAVRPQTSNTAENAGLVSKDAAVTDHRTLYQDRVPFAEVAGSHAFPVELGGSISRPGVHEIG